MPKDGAGVGTSIVPASDGAGEAVGAKAAEDGEWRVDWALRATRHVACGASGAC